MNYFEFFELPIRFDLDADRLRSIFLKNSKRFHPDFYTLESEEKQQEVLEMSTLNNEAYKVLSDFDQRMKYILELKGVLAEEGKNQIPQDFLMEMMDINEIIMEMEFDFNRTTYDNTIKKLEAIEKECFQSVESSIKNYDDGQEEENVLKKIKDYYLKKRYLLRIRENLNKFASL